MKKLLLLIGTAVVLTAAFTVVLTARCVPTETPVPPADEVAVPSGATERLAYAIRIATISPEDERAFDAAAFADLHAYLQSAFPRVHSALQRETVAKHSLLYTWPGNDPTLKAILLVGHMDVVPVEPGTEDEWQQEPFGGRISDGYIWGRGAIDNKSTVLGTLEAVEMLLADGFRPTRTVYLAYGHDEEVGGTNGARAIAALLESRGVALDMVLDEGGVIGDGVLPGISAPVALVGIAEKGFRDVEVERSGTGGPLVAATPSGRGRHRECGHRETGREPHAGAPRGSDAGTVQPNRTPVPHGATGRPRQSLAHATSCGSTATPRRHFPPLSPPPGGCHRRERHQKLQ